MFQRSGFLSLSQIASTLARELGEQTPNDIVSNSFEGSDRIADLNDPLSEPRRKAALVDFQIRVLLESIDEVVLFDDHENSVSIDAHIVLVRRQNSKGSVLETEIQVPLTEEGLIQFHSAMVDCWEFLDLELGIVRFPRRLGRGSFLWSANDRIAIRKLRKYDGWTLGIREEEVKEFVLWSKNVLSARKNTGSDCSGEASSAKDGLADALTCFQIAYPLGKQKATWAEVESNVGYSRRTINRAIAAFRDEGQ